MRSQIISVLTAAILSSTLLISCNDDSNQQASNRNNQMASKVDIDPNTGMIATSDYYAGEYTTAANTTNNTVSAPEPDNDPKLMDNPSAVNAAEKNRQIASTNTVDSEPGYVDKPAAGNNISGSDDQLVSNEINQDTYENEEENKNQNTLSQRNSALLTQLRHELNGIDNKIQGNFRDRQYDENRKPVQPKGEAKPVVNQELASLKLQKVKLESAIAKLQNDSTNNYKFTQEYISKNNIKLNNQTANTNKTQITQ